MSEDRERIQYLYKLAASLQQELPDLPYVPHASPVLWNGDRSDVRLLTVGTNPSPRDFAGENWPDPGRYANVPSEQSVSVWAENIDRTEAASKRLDTYFQRRTAYSGWFGKRGGAGLEAVMNGYGVSFYEGTALHMDLFPLALSRQMGKLPSGQREQLFRHPFVRKLLYERLRWIRPQAVLLLGSSHEPFLEERIEKYTWETYPLLRWQLGSTAGFPAVQLHARPSEPFLGLGSRRDPHGTHTGSYAVRTVLTELGEKLSDSLHKEHVDGIDKRSR